MNTPSLFVLVASLLALAAGPLIYAWAQQRAALTRALDGFVFVAIGGLVLIEVLPEVASIAGWWTILLVAAGLWGPTVLERAFAPIAHRTHMLTVLLSAAGLVVHTVLDGTVIAGGGPDVLALAVVLHRLPVGLAVWWLVRPVWGRPTAALMLAIMALGTVAGYTLGSAAVVQGSAFALAALQALVAGSILHVVFNRPHLDPGLEQEVRADRAEGMGNLLGLAVFLLVLASELAAGEAELSSLERLLHLSLAAAPALLLGYAAGGLLAAFMPESSMQWLGRGGSLSQAARGMVVGLPLPVCSCGVVPLYRSFIQRGAPPAAAMAFLIATPELGIDAILISIPLLGGEMTLARVIAAATVALLVGWLLGRVAVREAGNPACCDDDHLPKLSGSVGQRLRGGLRYGFGDLVDATAPWIVLGLLIAVIAQPLLEHSGLQQVPPAVQVVAFALLGLPVYVCATGSTPIVAVMLAAGVAPGAALAFLLTGPATNPATFGLLSRLHGSRVAALFGIAVGSLAIAAGWLLNATGIRFEIDGEIGALFHSPLGWVALGAMGLVFLASLTRLGARRFLSELRVMRAAPH